MSPGSVLPAGGLLGDGSKVPIGTVSRIETGEGELDRVIHVRPAAELRTLDIVEVLTEPDADLRAQAP